MLSSDRSRTWLISAFLLAAVLFQIYLVIPSYGWTWAKATLRTTNLTAMKRSSRFLFGTEGSDYIDFLSGVVPGGQPVVKPEGAGGYSHQNLLQFFLLPSGIPACPCIGAGDTSPECVECLLARSHYVPALGGFPEAAVIEDHKELVEFDGPSGWFQGVYIPEGASSELPNAQDTNSFIDWLLSSVTSLLIYGLIFIAGLAVVIPFLDQGPYGWSLAIAFPIGSGLITWLVFLLGWAGLVVSSVTYLLAFTAVCVPFVFWVLRSSSRQNLQAEVRNWKRQISMPMGRISPRSIGLFALLGLIGLSLMITVGRAYSTFDGIANWALKGYAIAHEGSIFAGSRWGGHLLEYPQNLHLQIA